MKRLRCVGMIDIFQLMPSFTQFKIQTRHAWSRPLFVTVKNSVYNKFMKAAELQVVARIYIETVSLTDNI